VISVVAYTLARASREASASAAIALCSWTGSLTSLLHISKPVGRQLSDITGGTVVQAVC